MWITQLISRVYLKGKKFGKRYLANVSSIYNCTNFGNKMNARRGGSPSKDGSNSRKH